MDGSQARGLPDAQGEAVSVASHYGCLPVPFSLDMLRDFDASSVAVEPVEPVDGRFGAYGGRCLLLRNVLTPEECAYLVREVRDSMEPVAYRHDYRRNDRVIFESHELAELLWRRVEPTARGLVVKADVEAKRQWLLPDAAARTGEAGLSAPPPLSGDCPSELQLGVGSEGVWHPVGLNECLRFCRYGPGDFFRAHCDARFKRSEEEQSLFTCMFYLDGDMAGGATRFLDFDAPIVDLQRAKDEHVLAAVEPRAGNCLLFFQPGLLHEGLDLQGGEKHILRTEVMFRRDPASKPELTPQQAEALACLRQAEAAENAGECDKAVGFYRRAFKLDPRLERMC